MTVTFDAAPVPLASVIVVTYGGWRWTRDALQALVENTPEPFEVILVDNDSPDDTVDRIRSEVRGATVLFNDRNLGFGQAANQGARLARAPYLVLLNSDAVVRSGWLAALTAAIERDPRAGAAVPRYLNPDGTVQEAGGLLFADGSTLMWGHGAPSDDPAFRFRRYVDYGSAACLVVRRSLFRSVGGFDAAYRPMYVEDVDLALSLRARGFRTVYEPRAEVVHVRFGSSDLAEGRARRLVEQNTPILRERWSDVLAARPPQDVDSPVCLLAARDADAVPRILVIGPAASAGLLHGMAAPLRRGRLTFLVVGPAPRAAEIEELLAEGVEVVPDVADPSPWLAGRPLHYDAVVPVGVVSGAVEEAIAAHQPQALVERIETGASASGVLSDLAVGGVMGEALAPA